MAIMPRSLTRRFAAPLALFLAAAILAAPMLLCQATLHVAARDSAIPPAVLRATPGAVWSVAEVPARDGARLAGSFARPPGETGRCVLVLHGVGDTRTGSSGFAPMLIAAGYAALFPDLRGHGRSGGDLVTYGLLEKFDVLQWIGWMKAYGCREIFGLGESLGAATLIQAAPLTGDFRAIVAESSYSDLREIGKYRVHRISGLPSSVAGAIVASAMLYARLRYGLDLSQASAVDAIARTSTPILLIHGLADSETPYAESQELAQADPHASLWLVPDAKHVGAAAAAPEEFRARVLGWFSRNARRP